MILVSRQLPLLRSIGLLDARDKSVNHVQFTTQVVYVCAAPNCNSVQSISFAKNDLSIHSCPYSLNLSTKREKLFIAYTISFLEFVLYL